MNMKKKSNKYLFELLHGSSRSSFKLLNTFQAEEYEIQTSLSYEGIGARLQNNEDFIEIVNLIPGGPADQNGS
ncbi:MAG: hypothetical protein Ct9H300mP6_17700 [Gammaproteobacteria bacterium]|nr:MAG: hypothetical protein Ct9H300mP6_17700 [Gammaproteobacteria bacterium]